MSTELEPTPMPEDEPQAGYAGPPDLGRLTDVTVELAVEVGRTYMNLGEAMALGPGSVVTLDRLADKPVDLLINGRSIARGEVVVIDEQFGLRITEVVSVDHLPSTVHEQADFVSLDTPTDAPPLALAPDPDEPAAEGGDAVMDADSIAAMFEQNNAPDESAAPAEAPAEDAGEAEEPPAAEAA